MGILDVFKKTDINTEVEKNTTRTVVNPTDINQKHYTLDDIEHMIYDAQNHDTEEEAWYQIKMYLYPNFYKRPEISFFNNKN